MSLLRASSANFQSILDAALDSYASQTGVDLTKHPSADRLQNCHSPEDVIQLFLERETAFKDYRDKYRNLIDRLRPIVQLVHAFSGILSEAAGLVPFQPTKVIFVGIDVLLSAAIGVSTSYDALLDLFECVANFLNRLHIYTERIPLSPTMSDIVVKILAQVLAVLALATRQVKQGRLKKFTKKLLGENDVEAILQRLDRLTQEEARMTAAHTLEVVHGLFNNLKEVMDDGKASTEGIQQALAMMQETTNRINKIERNLFQKDIRTWLFPPDPSTNHNIACRDHLDGTASWFIQSGVFKEWTTTGSFLWIYGKPGAGKSIFCSSIIKEIEGLCDIGLALMAYFYCDFRDPSKQEATGLLSSLIAQLAAKSDACYNILSSLYSDCDGGSKKPGDDALLECLEKMLKTKGLPTTYIIVDGLDECPNVSGVVSPRERVLQLVEKLVGLHCTDLRVCVTSRHEADINASLEPLASHTVSLHDEDGQKEDIDDYVRFVVYSDRNMRRWRMEDKEMVIHRLSQRGDGMFRWIVCQLEALRSCFPSTIRRALDDLPESLDETYERILLGIARGRQVYSQRLLHCIAVSIRPLRIEELADIFAINFDAGTLPNYNINWRPEDILAEEAVLLACSSLITIVTVDGSRVVQFSHYSVKEYLTSERLANAEKHLSRHHILPHFAHTILAQSSLSVLLALDSQVDKESVTIPPLTTYAARYWVDHAQFDDVSSNIEDAMVRLFDPAKPHFAIWVWMYDIDHPFREILFAPRPTQPEAVPLYYATLCGFRDLVKHLIVTCPQDINARGGFYDTPLHAAVVKGNIEVTMLLLEHGADATARNYEETTPLHEASRKAHVDIVELLLKHHADVDVCDGDEITPLCQASFFGELDVARVLLRHGASVELHNSEGCTPLSVASRNGHLDMVHLLLQSGAAPDSFDNDGRTPLMYASRKGYVNVVRLLLQSGVAVDTRDIGGWAPLMLASRYGHIDVILLLLQSGAAANIHTNDGCTPLMLASVDGHLDAVRLLLQNGAVLESRTNQGRTSLTIASQNGQVEVVGLLLQNGAAGDSSDNDGQTPLMAASQNGHVDVVRLLLQSGVAVDSRDKNGLTSLRTSLQGGHVDVVRLLLQSGADADARDNDGRTPLTIASQEGHSDIFPLLLHSYAAGNNDNFTQLRSASKERYLDIIRLLLQNGATVDSRFKNGQTPLMLASQRGHLEIIRLLLQNGATTESRTDQGLTPLDIASQNGHAEVVRLLLQSGAAVDVHDNEGVTPLILASYEGHPDIVDLLLQSGAAVDSPSNDGRTPLMVASQNGHPDIIRLLLQSGAAANSHDNGGFTPLMLASQHGHLDVINLLLQNGAALESRTNQGRTPLYIASQSGHADVVRLLLQSGAAVDPRDDDGWTPLMIASEKGHPDIILVLLQSGAAANTHNNYGWSPLMLASQYGQMDAIIPFLQSGVAIESRNGHSDVAPLLPQNGVAADRGGWTPSSDSDLDEKCFDAPLHIVSANGYLVMAELFIQLGADVNRPNQDGETPLSFASAHGWLKIAHLLLKSGSNVNSQDSDDSTPLHKAAQSGHLDIVTLLLDSGADVNIQNSNHKTALDVARDNNRLDVERILLGWRGGVDSQDRINLTLSDTSSQDSFKSFPDVEDASSQDSFKSFSDVDEEPSAGHGEDTYISDWRTSLHTASEDGDLEIVQSLLDGGADVDDRDSFHRTALFLASLEGNFKVAQLLIKHEADVNSRDGTGWTPLHAASKSGNFDIVRLLLDHGANVNTKKIDLWTALHLASYFNDFDVAKALLERGANVHERNDEGRTPFQLAVKGGHQEVMQLLSEYRARGVVDD